MTRSVVQVHISPPFFVVQKLEKRGYNEDMKHMKRTAKICFVSVFTILLITSLTILVINLIEAHREYSIEDILQTKFDNISYIKVGEEDYPVSEFINEYGNVKVKKFSGNIGSTTHRRLVAHDSNGQALFTLVEVGNRGLLYISKGFNTNENNSDLYQTIDAY